MNDYFDKFPDSYVENSRRVIQTPSAFARSAFFYVQETGYLKLRESHVARRKNLDSYLIVLVLSGSGTLMYNGQMYPLREGSCFFINCLIPYYHQSSDSDPWELIWVHFHGATSPEYYRYFSFHSAPAFSPHPFQELRGKLESLLDVNTHSDLSAEIASSRLIVDILSILLQDITGFREEQRSNPGKMDEIRRFLDEHYTERFSLDELSERFFLSKYHLSREFHNAYGITPSRYVIARRITYAKKLLRFSGSSLESIARSCGFYDASYLNKQFKKSEGISASDFRKKWIN
ncbi:MAG: helix-turn-helix domain-containing protein [Lachnospiraceae bacterium]|nr:helix-turn-helix domain-containing protein [Lachnospiraceae bacterium]